MKVTCLCGCSMEDTVLVLARKNYDGSGCHQKRCPEHRLFKSGAVDFATYYCVDCGCEIKGSFRKPSIRCEKCKAENSKKWATDYYAKNGQSHHTVKKTSTKPAGKKNPGDPTKWNCEHYDGKCFSFEMRTQRPCFECEDYRPMALNVDCLEDVFDYSGVHA